MDIKNVELVFLGEEEVGVVDDVGSDFFA